MMNPEEALVETERYVEVLAYVSTLKARSDVHRAATKHYPETARYHNLMADMLSILADKAEKL